MTERESQYSTIDITMAEPFQLEDENEDTIARDKEYSNHPETIARWTSGKATITPYRPRLSTAPSPGSSGASHTPRTPLFGRSISSNFNSPGVIFRQDDEVFVFEFGSRYMRAGLGGENHPRCRLSFGPEAQRRAGDYERWAPNWRPRKRRKTGELKTWGQDHALWQMDLREVDLRLVGEKIERAVKQALVEYLLIMDDSRKRQLILAIPPVMPHPLLSLLLTTLFNLFPPPPSITLLSTPVLNVVAAGLRSGLVVDVGWAETVVSAVYEYREVQHERSARGMKMLSWETACMIGSEIQRQNGVSPTYTSFEEVEEVVMRMIWCRNRADVRNDRSSVEPQPDSSVDPSISIPLQSTNPPTNLNLPFSNFALPVEHALFASHLPQYHHDDHEIPLPFLIYHTLLSLPIDIRHMCLSRIIITGGGADIPGLKARILAEVSHIIESRTWNPVNSYGSATLRKRPDVQPSVSIEQKPEQDYANKDVDPQSTTPAYLQPPLLDPILASIKSRADPSGTRSRPPGSPNRNITTDQSAKMVQGIATLGAWAGASLIAGLRVRGLVEIEREKFMQHGIAGADRSAGKAESVVAPQQGQSLAGMAGGGMRKAGEKGSDSWSLGIWA